MSRFFVHFASVLCLLVILTGPISAWHEWVSPTFPSNPDDAFYQAFQTVPSLDVTANQLMTNFLGYPNSARFAKRQTAIVDTVIVLDGSGSVPRCDFSKAKEALKHLMDTLNQPRYDSKYAAVTFSSTATVNFKFLPYSSAASLITTIPYPGGSTNTQAGLKEAKKLFDDPYSGRRPLPNAKRVFLVTDGRSNVDAHLTIPNADALKASGVTIYVVAVGHAISGIDELVKVASNPFRDLLRVKNFSEFWNLIQLTVKLVSPGKYRFVNYNPPCN